MHADELEKGITSVCITLSKAKALENKTYLHKMLLSLESESKAVSLRLKQFN